MSRIEVGGGGPGGGGGSGTSGISDSFLVAYPAAAITPLGASADINWDPGATIHGTDIELSESVASSGNFNRVLFNTDGYYVVTLDPLIYASTAAGKGLVECQAWPVEADPLNVAWQGNDWIRQVVVDGAYGSEAGGLVYFKAPGASMPQHFAAGSHMRVSISAIVIAGVLSFGSSSLLTVQKVG